MPCVIEKQGAFGQIWLSWPPNVSSRTMQRSQSASLWDEAEAKIECLLSNPVFRQIDLIEVTLIE